MSEQPTGDYRLVPWAYPPIPGGLSNSTNTENSPYDFSDLRVGLQGVDSYAPRIYTAGSTYISTYLAFQGIEVVNDSNVSQIQIKMTPAKIISGSGSVNVASYLPNFEFSVDKNTFSQESFRQKWNVELNPTPPSDAVGNITEFQGTVVISVLSASGAVIQQETVEVTY